MTRIDELLSERLATLPEKPADSASSSQKKRYSEQVSQCFALALGEDLRLRGLTDARPSLPGADGGSGAERRMSGGIGAKKVDVTWATEESGLLLGISVKSINFRDTRTRNFQKNLTNRRGDMLFEAVTLHRRFPYAVLGGFFILDAGAAHDETDRRRSTFENTHLRMRLFTGRDDPAGRDEQYERMYVLLLDASSSPVSLQTFEAGAPDRTVSLDEAVGSFVAIVADRNPDFYAFNNGSLETVRG